MIKLASLFAEKTNFVRQSDFRLTASDAKESSCKAEDFAKRLPLEVLILVGDHDTPMWVFYRNSLFLTRSLGESKGFITSSVTAIYEEENVVKQYKQTCLFQIPQPSRRTPRCTG